jgi:phage shock protein PspC (stress-responsive transcriptional regulator)
MKQVININFQGRVVPIEVTAFDQLKAYTESLNRHFAGEEGKEEIINDIESRMGELFQERLNNGATCITDDDVSAVIKSMGRPEDFESEEEVKTNNQAGTSASQGSPVTGAPVTHKRLYRDEENKVLGGVCAGIANYFGIDTILVRVIFILSGIGWFAYILLWIFVPSSSGTTIGGVRKKLYRDSDDKIVAGVCSGLGNYFGINPWIPRVLFALPFLSFAFRWGHWGLMNFPDLLRIGFSPSALIFYIILWIVLPEAVTTSEKLEMKGEKVDMNSIVK